MTNSAPQTMKGLLSIKSKLIILSLLPLTLFTMLVLASPLFNAKAFVFISVGAIIATAIVSLATIHSIISPLCKLQRAIEISAQDSDLTLCVESTNHDSIGFTANAFNQMLQKFHSIVQEVNFANAQLVSSSKRLSAIATETKNGFVDQNGELNHVSHATTDMTKTIDEIAQSASHAADAARNADEAARSGSEVIDRTLKSITTLCEEVEKVGQVIERVESDSLKIGSVVTVIKGIAEKTNLLALNAAIEAARAGEQGRGFAVVAEEVGTLAKRTSQATQEIQHMIEGLQSGVKEAVTAIEDEQQRARRNVEKASAAGNSLASIMNAVQLISDMNGQIAEATENHKQVAEAVNATLQKINLVSNANSENAMQTAEASQAIESIATNLQNMVGVFKIRRSA